MPHKLGGYRAIEVHISIQKYESCCFQNCQKNCCRYDVGCTHKCYMCGCALRVYLLFILLLKNGGEQICRYDLCNITANKLKLASYSSEKMERFTDVTFLLTFPFNTNRPLSVILHFQGILIHNFTV